MAPGSRGTVTVRPPLPPEAWLWAPSARPPFPLDQAMTRLYGTAMQALRHGVQASGLVSGDEVLLPHHHRGPVAAVFSNAGVTTTLYGIGTGFEPDGAELESSLSPRTRALYLAHHNGFPQDMRHWRRWCDERGLLLIEDGAQAWLAERDGVAVGSLADVAFFSARLTFGVPGGGILVTREAPAGRGGAGAESASRPPSVMDRLLRRLVAQDAAAARRSNYRSLLRALEASTPEPFRDLPDGASPFYFPVLTQHVGPVAEFARKGIGVINGESTARQDVRRHLGPRTGGSSGATVGLPVHHELSARDLERIATAASPLRRRRPELRLEPVGDIEALGSEWDDLALRSGNLFATREWVSTWWHHHGGGRDWRVTACRDATGRLLGVLPLCLSTSGPLRMLRFIGHGAGDRLGPICARTDVDRVARAMDSMLRRDRSDWDLLLAERLPSDDRWAALLRGTRLRFESSPSLCVSWRSFDAYLASRSRNFREQVGRRERKLLRKHQARYRLCADPQTLEGDMSALFALHEARWGGASDAFTAERQAFHRDFAARAMERGWLRLWTLELDGSPAAVWYGFRFANCEWYYQSGRDPAFERDGVGFVLLSKTLRAAVDEGVDEYKLLRGDEGYKSRLANSDCGLETFVIGRGLAGRAAIAGAAAASALPADIRRQMRGLVG